MVLNDLKAIRSEFPALLESVHGHPLVYLDNGATTQKPKVVVEAMRRYYENYCANVHRGSYFFSEVATQAYEKARQTVKDFINAAHLSEVIFTRGTTDSINLVAGSYGRAFVQEGDEILVSHMEHHSNLVPWQILCEEKGAFLEVAPINDQGEIDVEAFEKCLSSKTRIVALTHVSNALGTINPLKSLIQKAHAHGAIVVVDGAQGLPHLSVDVQDLDCDFYAFSAHKVYGPTGTGVLYGKQKWLEKMPPYQGGGDMIASVTFEKTTYAKPPAKFEAGTPNIAGVIGLGAALEFLNQLDLKAAHHHEDQLLAKMTQALSKIEGLRLIGTAKHKTGACSFVLKDIHPHDISSILDRQGVAIRAGHLCAQPIMKRFGVHALARASVAIYNTEEDVDALSKALNKVTEVF